MNPLEAAIAIVESEFCCHEWVQAPQGTECGIAPTGEPYVTVCAGGIKPEGEAVSKLYKTPELAAEAWLEAVRALGGGAWGFPTRLRPPLTLYWRIKPEETEIEMYRVSPIDGRLKTEVWHSVYSRLLITAKPA